MKIIYRAKIGLGFLYPELNIKEELFGMHITNKLQFISPFREMKDQIKSVDGNSITYEASQFLYRASYKCDWDCLDSLYSPYPIDVDPSVSNLMKSREWVINADMMTDSVQKNKTGEKIPEYIRRLAIVIEYLRTGKYEFNAHLPYRQLLLSYLQNPTTEVKEECKQLIAYMKNNIEQLRGKQYKTPDVSHMENFLSFIYK